MELWAAIDLLGGSAVTLVQGRADERTVWEESPLQLARRWRDEGADGLHIIDLDAAFGTGSNGETIRAVIKESGVPVQLGGGMRSAKTASAWLEAGAARVILGTLAFSEPAAARGLVETHGPERVVVAADYREGIIVTRGWKESQGIPIIAGAKRLEGEGFRNLLPPAAGSGGMGSVPDVEIVRELSLATRMKILASGGIRDIRDLVELGRAGASAAVIGRALYEETVSLAEAKKGVT